MFLKNRTLVSRMPNHCESHTQGLKMKNSKEFREAENKTKVFGMGKEVLQVKQGKGHESQTSICKGVEAIGQFSVLQ